MKRRLKRYADAIILVVIPEVIIGTHINGWMQLLKELSIWLSIIIAFFILRFIYQVTFAFIKSLIKSGAFRRVMDKPKR